MEARRVDAPGHGLAGLSLSSASVSRGALERSPKFLGIPAGKQAPPLPISQRLLEELHVEVSRVRLKDRLAGGHDWDSLVRCDLRWDEILPVDLILLRDPPPGAVRAGHGDVDLDRVDIAHPV